MANGEKGEPTEDNIEPTFDINGEARAHGGYLGLPQDDGESDSAYRHRIAGVLRENNQIIEAHEVQSGRRYDDPEQGEFGPMTGIIGAMVQKLQGHEYSPGNGVNQVGDDLAAGIVSQHRDPTADAIGAMFDLLGPAATMDMLGGSRPNHD